jgi:hypothetical protein
MKAATAKKYLKPHKIMSRWTTFNGSMQAALAVPEVYDAKRHADALALLGQNVEDDLRCVYCEAQAATWDHLENNVKAGRFSGFGHRIYNLVPACRTCNEKKGSKPWQAFLEERNAADKAARAVALKRFSARNAKESFGWGQIERELPELAREYDRLRDEIQEKLRAADAVALKIRAEIASRIPGASAPTG